MKSAFLNPKYIDAPYVLRFKAAKRIFGGPDDGAVQPMSCRVELRKHTRTQEPREYRFSRPLTDAEMEDGSKHGFVKYAIRPFIDQDGIEIDDRVEDFTVV